MDALLSLCLAGAPDTTADTLWQSWSLAPQTAVPLLAALGAYVLGLRRRPLPRWRIACFAAGWAVLVLALVSPLCRLAATLVSAHMVQHVLLAAVAPPLLVLGTPAAWRRRWSPSPLMVGLLYGLAIWLWHLPPIYAAVLLDATAHTLAYAALIGLGLLFWSTVAREGTPALALLFATLVHTGVLGALLTFSPRPWYPLLAGGAELWGQTPLADQQLAGLIMWVPMSLIYLGAALALAARYLRVTGPGSPRPLGG